MQDLPNGLPTRQLLQRMLVALQGLYDPAEARAHQRIIAEHLWGCPYHALVLGGSSPAPPTLLRQWLAILQQLQAGVPIQLVLGFAYFYGRRFAVSPGTLVPRRETEELVHYVLQRVGPGSQALDLGTGSGCIAITLALESQGARVEAIDISAEALRVAQSNANTHRVGIRLRPIDMLAAAQQPDRYWPPRQFDAIVSNPPYIPLRERAQMDRRVVDHEPHAALFVPDEDPLLFYRAILSIARHALAPGGLIACECHEELASQTLDLFHRAGHTSALVMPDAQGKPRIVASR